MVVIRIMRACPPSKLLPLFSRTCSEYLCVLYPAATAEVVDKFIAKTGASVITLVYPDAAWTR